LSRIGLLSDSHGRAGTTHRAVELLVDRGADRLIHLGDIGSHEVVDALLATRGEAPLPVNLVFGNVDWDIDRLATYARRFGLTVDHPAGEIEVAGRRIAFLHGHEEARLQALVHSGVDYVCHGHSHRQRDERVAGATGGKGVRLVNPGALFRASCYSVAILDPQADTLEFIEVPSPSTTP